ncbi:GtrA family protein [Aquabacterium sp.]|uniref:GtrA family protein n=1 Tax=Aquabacterium sp. TaxID=1872578 RepID=UPI0025C4ED59|nr:GtrA family protein [Aquabacterium sp.]
MLQRFRSLILFCISGGLALFVDIGVLYVSRPWLGSYGGRVLSFLAAATFTWLFNRNITFKGPKEGSVLKEYLTYLSSMAVGGAINYGTYAACIQAFEMVRHQPEWGVAIGSVVAMGFNFMSARRIMKGTKA